MSVCTCTCELDNQLPLYVLHYKSLGHTCNYCTCNVAEGTPGSAWWRVNTVANTWPLPPVRMWFSTLHKASRFLYTQPSSYSLWYSIIRLPLISDPFAPSTSCQRGRLCPMMSYTLHSLQHFVNKPHMLDSEWAQQNKVHLVYTLPHTSSGASLTGESGHIIFGMELSHFWSPNYTASTCITTL